MGSFPLPPAGLRLLGIDVLILCAEELQPPDASYPYVMVLRARLDDTMKLPVKSLLEANDVALAAAHLIRRQGSRVLVTCAQGRNRSGLVAGLILCKTTGCSGAEAAKIIQTRRRAPHGPALTNTHFVDILSRHPRRKGAGDSIGTRGAVIL